MRIMAGMVCIGVLAGCERGPVDPAELVLRGGVVRTMEASMPTASAVAVRLGRIVYVGDDAGATAFVGPGTEVVDLAGRMVLPGFHDTHVHPVSGGTALSDCDLHAATSREDVVRLVGDCAARATGAAWVRGGGYSPTIFDDGAPPRELLDSLVPDRPAYLEDATGHAAWVNGRALAAAGVDARTPNPAPDGIVVRRADGSAQGTLREAAMELVSRRVPPHTEAELGAGLDRALAMAASLGITTLHEVGGDERSLRTYAGAERDGRLTARVLVALVADPTRGGAQVAGLAAARDRFTGRLARVVAAKIFLDGVIEGGTAALLEPYVDRPGWRGELRATSPDTLASLVSALDSAGFKVHVHAIGDRAVRAALDALARPRERGGGTGPRHVLAHLQLIDPVDLPRLAQLGVVASFQLLWAYRDAYIVELTEPRLGAERSGRLYPIESVRASGATVAGGSDWPVTSMDPLDAIEVAVTRLDPAAAGGETWIPTERLSLDEALRAYTVGGALAGDLEAESGSIQVGKGADLAVLDRDLYAIPAREISDGLVDLTIFEGRIVYRRPGS
jgi:predicted amidohydrolase YtcJ